MDDKREWCIKSTYEDGTVDYGSNLDRERAEAWIKVQNRAWPNIKHEVVHISERPQEEQS